MSTVEDDTHADDAGAEYDAVDGYDWPMPRRSRRAAVLRLGRRSLKAWNMLLLFPVFSALFSAEIVRTGLEKRRRAAEPGQHPTRSFRRPRSMPRSRTERSVHDIMSHLRAVPFRPLRQSARITFTREYGTDGVGLLLGSESALGRLPHQYPSIFQSRLWTGADGVQLAGLLAMQDGPAPAIIICHGLMSSKYVGYMRDMAMRAFRRWGFHVALIDLRGFGQSAWTTDAPTSGGSMEGRDLIEVARTLHADPRVLSVGAMGYSLGGATVLNAAHVASETDPGLLDGGVLSVCAPTDIQTAMNYISQRPAPWHPFFMPYLIFRASMHASIRRSRMADPPSTWAQLVTRIASPYYGRSLEQLNQDASALNWAAGLRVPTLALHARDDFVVPVAHADRLASAAAGNPDVAVLTVSQGNHCAFPSVDNRWYGTVTRRWFEYWANEPGQTTAATTA